MERQQSPWEIGRAYYDQRDLYTVDARIDEAGYAVGPSLHPEEGSYAYPRDGHPDSDEPSPPAPATSGNLYAREAWPWLNYVKPERDPYFAFLRRKRDGDGRRWDRLTHAVSRVKSLVAKELGAARARLGRDPFHQVDKRLRREVGLALARAADLDATDIDVSVRWAVVTLEGTVPDRRSRILAETIARDASDVRGVRNKLTIRTDDPRDAHPIFVMPLAAL
jgi:hypothetical protein